jgi:hypothetical protein
VSSDIGKLLTVSSSSTVTITFNTSTAFNAGERVDFVRLGTGSVILANGAGVTFYSTPGPNFRAQYSGVSVICIASNTYIAIGDLSA